VNTPNKDVTNMELQLVFWVTEDRGITADAEG